ncbi:aldo/keto reductase [Sphingomicrobium aestuariivivum]|uniref:aldo/keto reductase n=1 Tax=Sphingomicrobium aestuariivivum TaxID=1582356 RepID=UPI001FD6781D|nr:aldo/keto reductase [Sphingomicrobium aestuariivivum]MCJ8191294.1 aldo/keto reductase [Sphingomicrobium aestuariivivum]
MFDLDPFRPDAADVEIPAVGIGTWHMGEDGSKRREEVAALRHAIDLGFTHFDTAEMYADGGAEEVLGEAIADTDRDKLFLVSKFYPWNADPDAMLASCAASLDRLGIEQLDLYLLHWPGDVPFEETLEGARRLLDEGRIRAFGVSNFDEDALSDLADRQLLDMVAANQVMHNIPHRAAEAGLFPFMAERGIAAIAYSPLEIGPMREMEGLDEVAEEAGLTLAQLAVAWHLTLGLAAPIPKSARQEHLDQIAAAVAAAPLSADLMQAIDAIAPLPDPGTPLPIR